MATKELYEPSARFLHSAFSIDRRVYVRGGRTDDFESGSEDGKLELANSIEQFGPFLDGGEGGKLELANAIEQFDPFLEVWRQLKTTAGTPHPGLAGAACVSFGENVYMYGGYSGKRDVGALSCLNVKSLTWSLLCPERVAGGPMRKEVCGIVMFHRDKLAVIGGAGYPSGPAQAGSMFIKTDKNGMGWTNEFHVFNIGQGSVVYKYIYAHIDSCIYNSPAGLWSSPLLKGTRLPPCAHFTLTSIDNNRAVLFAGRQIEHGRVNDLYMIDFDIMV